MTACCRCCLSKLILALVPCAFYPGVVRLIKGMVKTGAAATPIASIEARRERAGQVRAAAQASTGRSLCVTDITAACR